MIGFKYKMSNIQAAIGCAQMERVDELIAGKRRVFKSYEARLTDLPLRMNPEHQSTVNGYWMPTIVIDDGISFNREALIDAFKSENIDGRVFFWPLSLLPMLDSRTENKVADGLYNRATNLPTYHDLSEDDIDRVCRIVRTFF
jgi:perosamine synthetase